MNTLLIVYKRAGQRKADNSPYLHIKALVPVGSRAQMAGYDVVDQYVAAELDTALSAVPGVYEYQSEQRAMNGRLEHVITSVRLVEAGFGA